MMNFGKSLGFVASKTRNRGYINIEHLMTNELPSANSWLAFRRTNDRARLRLFCFPYAGGGIHTFRGWLETLGPNVDVCPIQLPGRESRLREPPLESIREMVAQISAVVAQFLELPTVFLGHSMGAVVAFEVVRELRRRGLPLPKAMIVSGSKAPQQLPVDHPIHGLPDEEFLQKVRQYNGIPQQVLQSDELIGLMLPALKADFRAFETYSYLAEEPLAIPISAYGGLRDAGIARSDLEAWNEQSTHPVIVRMFPGDHFFINQQRQLYLQMLGRELLPLT